MECVTFKLLARSDNAVFVGCSDMESPRVVTSPYPLTFRFERQADRRSTDSESLLRCSSILPVSRSERLRHLKQVAGTSRPSGRTRIVNPFNGIRTHIYLVNITFLIVRVSEQVDLRETSI